MSNIQNFIEEIRRKDKELIVGIKRIPGKKPIYAEFRFENNNILQDLLDKLGFKLYKHQVDALSYLYSGKNVILTTPTASGKSEVFRLYIIDKFLSNPSKRFLLIYPTRALLYDQEEKLKERINLIETNRKPKIGILLGDLSSAEKRNIIKEKPNILLTTPDTLHYYILRNHYEFSWLFRNLDLIVVDELHSYRGVFGTNAIYVFKRMFIITEYVYKNRDYKILALSATLKNSKEFAEKFFDKKFEIIDKNSAKLPDKYLIAIDPSDKYSGFTYLKLLTMDLIAHNIKSLVFLETKRSVEKMKIMFWEADEFIDAYKGSLTREIRKDIENKFKKGDIKVLFTTSALELGIDIGDVEAVVNYGIPPDGLFSLIQRFGRAGRKSEGINIIVYRNDALDQYYKENVTELFDRIEKNLIEEIPINKENFLIVKKHALLLVKELGSVPVDNLDPYFRKAMEELEKEGYVIKRKNIILDKEFYIPTKKASRVAYPSIRTIGDEAYFVTLYSEGRKERLKNIEDPYKLYQLIQFYKIKNIIIEEVDKSIYYSQLLPGMVYYSRGIPYEVVDSLNLGKFNFVFIKRKHLPKPIETRPIYTEDVGILSIESKKEILDLKVYLGKLKITRYYEGFIKTIASNEVDIYKISKPVFYDSPFVYEYETKGIWFVLPDWESEVRNLHLNKYLKILEHYLKKKDIKLDIDYIKMFVDSIDKETIYNRYRGATNKIIRKYIERFLTRNGINVEKHKKLVFLIKKLVDSPYAFQSGLHAIEHCIINLSPVVTNLDRRELGGYSYEMYKTNYPNDVSQKFLYKPIIFIYEGYENGTGLAEIIYENFEKLLKACKKRINSCNCLDGCPKCIMSTKCGNANEFLDKFSAKIILKKLWGRVRKS